MEAGRFRMGGVIRPSKDLIGHHYALKLSWPLKARINEIEAFKHLHSVIPDLADHLPALHFSDSFTAHDLDLPWTKLNLTVTAENHQERVFRILASKLYKKLWKAGSVEAFKQAWLDCVECHFQASEKGNILHRDLSENNLMLYLGKEGRIKGVLNDWDMASFKDTLGKIDWLLAAHHRTGTPPFMAIDLLKADPPPHLYRHELESFFYILLWGALHYDVSAGVRHPTVMVIKRWEGEYGDIGNAKNAFFSDYEVAEPILDAIRPEFHELRDEWIEPLYWLIRDARASRPVPRPGRKAPTEAYDHDTYGGNLTFWTFMEAIGQKARWAKRMETKEEEEGVKQETKEKDN
ncbi:hypothetical protein EST38_g4307 [Candolleomyces aberdarensis]|uniref:Protein kinase domain-containing protein n=1 Tax=Candolleomyces aberdarensis TaxID=2316362 RepID=A0A4Q2DN94_9AGAR|nr:hypothetical protein EST38_g4307 [Candolleomyces aberdarensis]